MIGDAWDQLADFAKLAYLQLIRANSFTPPFAKLSAIDAGELNETALRATMEEHACRMAISRARDDVKEDEIADKPAKKSRPTSSDGENDDDGGATEGGPPPGGSGGSGQAGHGGGGSDGGPASRHQGGGAHGSEGRRKGNSGVGEGKGEGQQSLHKASTVMPVVGMKAREPVGVGNKRGEGLLETSARAEYLSRAMQSKPGTVRSISEGCAPQTPS